MSNHWHPNGVGVLLETMDGTLDLSDVTWQEIARCGCISGVTIAATNELIVTAEQAGRHFNETDAQYQRDVDNGITWRAREHHAAIDEAKSDCPHDPKWGVPTLPKPEGYVWAAVYALGRAPKLTHLVAAEAVAAAKAGDYGRKGERPLCGGKAAFHWSDEWHATTRTTECKRCIAKARKAAS